MGNLNGNRYSSLTQISNRTSARSSRRGTSTSALRHEERGVRLARGERRRRRRRLLHRRRRRATSSRSTRRNRARSSGTGRPDLRPGLQRRHGRPAAGRRDRRGQGLRRARATASSSRSTRCTAASSGRPRSCRGRRAARLSDAPIYFNGMVIAGDSGGDGGSVSERHARRSTPTTAAQLWTWSVDPGAGSAGQQHVAAGGTDTHYGGGSMWESPLIDAKLNLAIFGTGNPVPWNSRGPGTNLYTDSIVALERLHRPAGLGLPDDAPRPVGLGPAEQRRHVRRRVQLPKTTTVKVKHRGQGPRQVRDAKFTKKKVTKLVPTKRPGVAFVNKYGMTFILDRGDRQAAAPDQGGQGPAEHRAGREHVADAAVPQGDNVLFNKLDADGRPVHGRHLSQTNAYVPYATGHRAGRQAVQDRLRIRPVRHDAVRRDAVRDDGLAGELVQPGEPHVHHLRRHRPRRRRSSRSRGLAGRRLRRRHRRRPPRRRRHVDGEQRATSRRATCSTSKLAWHQHWHAPCYSGSMNTAAASRSSATSASGTPRTATATSRRSTRRPEPRSGSHR